jgi:hypothetical protein
MQDYLSKNQYFKNFFITNLFEFLTNKIAYLSTSVISNQLFS